jgi:hypothetical protein
MKSNQITRLEAKNPVAFLNTQCECILKGAIGVRQLAREELVN